MKLLRTLLWAEAREHPRRLVPGLLAMLVSVALIIWMMGHYDALVEEFDEGADAYLGEYALCVVPDLETDVRSLPEGLADRLAADPLVERVDRSVQKAMPIGKGQKGKSFDDFIRDRMGIPSQSPILVGTDAAECPYELEEGRWPDMSSEQGAVGVLGSASASFFKVKVGDTLFVRNGARVTPIEIVGIVKQLEAHPDISSSLRQGAGPALASLFVPVHLFERVCETPFAPNLLNLVLKEGVPARDVEARWRDDPSFAGALFADTEAVQKRLEDNRSVRRMKDSARSAAGMVLFACVFIIFTTLSMGVMERSRRLALLRALGLTKSDVAALIVGESVLLGILSFLLGCAAGLGLLLWNRPAGADANLVLPSATTLLIAFGCSTGGALLASVIPAWRATRLLPLEAAMEHAHPAGGYPLNKAWLMAVAGATCLAVQPAVLLLPGLSPECRKLLFAWAGYPALVAGILLLTPGLVVAVERLFTRPLAAVLRVNPVLMRLQLTANMLRTAGTAVALTVGLGLYMAVQIWGYSMVVPFLPDKSMPDTLVSFLHTQFKGRDLDDLLSGTRLGASGLLPILVEEPDISPAQLHSPAFHSIQQKSVVVAGIPLDAMMTGDKAPFTPVFVSGTRNEALRMMKAGRSLLIPDTFATATGLTKGDVLELVHPERPDEVQQWTVAGVVYLPGWHWLTKTSGMRVRRGHFIAALTIADEGMVRSSFGADGIRFFWGNDQLRIPSQQMQDSLQGFLAERDAGSDLKPLVKVTRTGDLVRRVQGMADRSITAMSNLPLIALLIASLALMNAVLASVAARKREFRLMYAVGVTKGTIFRLVLGESLLIGVTAVAASFVFGVVAAWGGIEVLRYGYVFGGVTPPLTIPWTHLFYGAGVTLLLCLPPLLFARWSK